MIFAQCPSPNSSTPFFSALSSVSVNRFLVVVVVVVVVVVGGGGFLSFAGRWRTISELRTLSSFSDDDDSIISLAKLALCDDLVRFFSWLRSLSLSSRVRRKFDCNRLSIVDDDEAVNVFVAPFLFSNSFKTDLLFARLGFDNDLDRFFFCVFLAAARDASLNDSI
jgi:hypothetical protein